MKAVSVKNMTSNRGNKIPNQFEIRTDKGVYFQSYGSIIAFVDKSGQVTLDNTYWNYSKTTGKYRNQVLGENKAETLKKINQGVYKLADLNSKD